MTADPIARDERAIARLRELQDAIERWRNHNIPRCDYTLCIAAVACVDALPALLDCVEAAKHLRKPYMASVNPHAAAFDAALARLNADGGAHRQSK